jgi:zinc transporter ZupT
MEKKDKLTKTLAIAGTVLVWLPMLAPVFFSVIRFIQARRFMFDYLVPAEFFPVALVGGGLLLWAAFRARSRREVIGWGLAAAVGLLIVSMAVATVTGLASGETEEGGWQWALVLILIAGFWLALVGTGVGGILLVRDLSK